jgi:hypothetical protein
MSSPITGQRFSQTAPELARDLLLTLMRREIPPPDENADVQNDAVYDAGGKAGHTD